MRRKSRSKTTMNHQNEQTVIGTTSPVAPVALLIDGENALIPDLIAHMLVEAGKMGGVTIRQVYGNWAAPCMQSWKKHLTHYPLEPMGNRPGHNSTDIPLFIGPMDPPYPPFTPFCLFPG